MAAVTAAAITAGAAIAGGAMQANAAKKAGKAAQAGAQAGIGEQQAAREQFQDNISPYLQAGQTGLASLNALNSGDYSGFQDSPDYLYTRGQMQQGIERGAAARGSLYSGGTSVDLGNALNGMASQNLGTYRNSLFDMVRLGQNSAVGAGQMGQQSANAISGLYAGQAQAAGDAAINKANAWGGALQGLAGAAGGYAGQRQSAYSNPSTPYANMGTGVAVGNNTYRGGW